MALLYTLTTPLDLVLFGDHASSAASKGRGSASHPIQPHKQTSPNPQSNKQSSSHPVQPNKQASPHPAQPCKLASHPAQPYKQPSLNPVQPCKQTLSQPGKPSKQTSGAAGHFDIIETTASYEFIADAPGFDPSDIDVELKDKVLTISSKQQQERKEQKQEEGEEKQPDQQQQQQQQGQQASEPEVKVWRSERRLRQFSRSFELPDDANTEDISASLDKGVLTVRVAKLPPAPKPVPRQIAVQAPAAARAC